MLYVIVFRATAEKELARLPTKIQDRIERAIDALVKNPRPSGVRKLHNTNSSYRIRVGDYRVIYSIKDKVLVVEVIRIGHRCNIYKQ